MEATRGREGGTPAEIIPAQECLEVALHPDMILAGPRLELVCNAQLGLS